MRTYLDEMQFQPRMVNEYEALSGRSELTELLRRHSTQGVSLNPPYSTSSQTAYLHRAASRKLNAGSFSYPVLW